MPYYYYISGSIDVRNDDTEFFILEEQDYLEAIIPSDRIRVFKTEEDAIMVAQEDVDPNHPYQYPVFTLEYNGDNKDIKVDQYTIMAGEHEDKKLLAFCVDANKVKLISATLEFVSPEFKRFFFENPEDELQDQFQDESKAQVPISSPSPRKHITEKLVALAKPGLAGVAGVAFWYFGGPDLITPYLANIPLDAMTHYLADYATTAMQIVPSATIAFASYGVLNGMQTLFNGVKNKLSTPSLTNTLLNEEPDRKGPLATSIQKEVTDYLPIVKNNPTFCPRATSQLTRSTPHYTSPRHDVIKNRHQDVVTNTNKGHRRNYSLP